MSGEFELIARLTPHLARPGGAVLVGPGDDAAVVEVDGGPLCLTVDVLVDGVHFRRDLSSWADVGWKAIAVNMSDLAAMGASPVAAVVGLIRPADLADEAVTELYAGMAEACDHWGLQLVGGDTVAGAEPAVAVTAVGTVDGAPVLRSGALAGDRLLVVGVLGAAAAALALHAADRPVDDLLLAAHRRPRALVAGGQALRAAGATAMIDVSDGLGADVGHICQASGVSALLDADALPVAPGVAEVATTLGVDPLTLATGGGEDFALVAAVPPTRVDAVVSAVTAAEQVPVVVVGEVVPAGQPVVGLRRPGGAVADITASGYDHYAGRGRREEDQ